jgi:uncharacterized membrane protein YphA (DoxX/SURF4 family)
MQSVSLILEVTVSLVLLNVWLLRFGRSTAFRGGNANSMREEFAVYGLPVWCMYAVGVIKVTAALCLLAGLWFRSLVLPAALVVSALMIAALAMHLKIGDPMKKSMPALSLLGLSAAICVLSIR